MMVSVDMLVWLNSKLKWLFERIEDQNDWSASGEKKTIALCALRV